MVSLDTCGQGVPARGAWEFQTCWPGGGPQPEHTHGAPLPDAAAGTRSVARHGTAWLSVAQRGALTSPFFILATPRSHPLMTWPARGASMPS